MLKNVLFLLSFIKLMVYLLLELTKKIFQPHSIYTKTCINNIS
jgi:TRAP-type mannitol/chloroaromatic compound transport system permease small subunit